MRTIYKYPFEVEDRIEISMPVGAAVVSVACQGRQNCVWAIVDTDAPVEVRAFVMRGTGHPLPPDVGAWVATWAEGPFMWHLFEAGS